MQHKDTGSSKGFGFVTFASPEIASFVAQQSHYIEGRRVDCKKARPKEIFGDWGDQSGPLITTKIFVGGLPDDL